MMDIWQATLVDLETKVSSHNFESWFKNIRFHHQEGRIAHLMVHDEFLKAWIEENYVDLIEDSLSSVAGTRMRVVINAPDEMAWRNTEPSPEAERSVEWVEAEPQAARMARLPATPQGEIFASVPAGSVPGALAAPSVVHKAPQAIAPIASTPAPDIDELARRAGLNPRYSFDEFVVGPSNQFTHAACVSIAKHPGINYNPLFIFGGVGLGKTHLLQAVGIEILRRDPTARVVMLSAEEFMNQLITSLRQKDMNAFRAQYRDNCDVLLIDDIQFIGGKDSTQEEFFHTFNALHQSGKQIVLTSDKSPKELPGIEERLQSRFSWGLTADVQPPEIETRLAILEKKAEADGLVISKEVAMCLASAIRSNVRDLEGTLVRLSAQASLMGHPITLELVHKHLKRMNIERAQPITSQRIIQVVAERFHIEPGDILGARRTRSISEPRQLAMFLARQLTDHSYPELGRHFGGKDHTTVLAACRKLEKLTKQDPSFAATVEEIKAALRR